MKTQYELACENIADLKFRYNQASKSKGYLSQMFSYPDIRIKQIEKLEYIVSGINILLERFIQKDVLTDGFNASAVKGCYFLILNEIQSTYKNNPENFTNSLLVKILLQDLELKDIPSIEDSKQDIKNYKILMSFIETFNSVNNHTLIFTQ